MAEEFVFELLPADLPEDWNAGQIVAPTGEEAGLSHQHGYNYLMEQVNKAQRALNVVNKSISEGIGGGFVEMKESIPVQDRKKDALYGLIITDYTM